MKHETEHLSAEFGFVTIRKLDDDDIDCGKIREDGSTTCHWPRILGPQPTWFDDEVDELCDMVSSHADQLSAEYMDYCDQVDADYLRERGAK